MAESPDNALFVEPGHFYSPVTLRSRNRAYLTSAHFRAQCARVDAMIDMPGMLKRWDRIGRHAVTFPFEQDPGFRYHGRNNQFCYYDATILSAMLHDLRPRRVIEIGSGFSSAVIFDTVERSRRNRLESFTTIDPDLGRIGKLRPPPYAQMLQSEVQKVPLETFDALAAGDLLFIDSSHVLKTGSDVHFEFLNILPRLKPGVVIHVHDVFYPFEYPRGWLVGENRAWNEAYLVDMLLTHGKGYRLLMFNDVFLGRFPEERRRAGDMFDRFAGFAKRPFHGINGSVWLVKAA